MRDWLLVYPLIMVLHVGFIPDAFQLLNLISDVQLYPFLVLDFGLQCYHRILLIVGHVFLSEVLNHNPPLPFCPSRIHLQFKVLPLLSFQIPLPVLIHFIVPQYHAIEPALVPDV